MKFLLFLSCLLLWTALYKACNLATKSIPVGSPRTSLQSTWNIFQYYNITWDDTTFTPNASIIVRIYWPSSFTCVSTVTNTTAFLNTFIAVQLPLNNNSSDCPTILQNTRFNNNHTILLSIDQQEENSIKNYHVQHVAIYPFELQQDMSHFTLGILQTQSCAKSIPYLLEVFWSPNTVISSQNLQQDGIVKLDFLIIPEIFKFFTLDTFHLVEGSFDYILQGIYDTVNANAKQIQMQFGINQYPSQTIQNKPYFTISPIPLNSTLYFSFFETLEVSATTETEDEKSFTYDTLRFTLYSFSKSCNCDRQNGLCNSSTGACVCKNGFWGSDCTQPGCVSGTNCTVLNGVGITQCTSQTSYFCIPTTCHNLFYVIDYKDNACLLHFPFDIGLYLMGICAAVFLAGGVLFGCGVGCCFSGLRNCFLSGEEESKKQLYCLLQVCCCCFTRQPRKHYHVIHDEDETR